MVRIADDLVYWLALHTMRNKFNVATLPNIIEKFGTLESFWQADKYDIIEAGWNVDAVNAFIDHANKTRLSRYEKVIYEADNSDTRILTYMDEEYPKQLRTSATARYQPPIVLFVKGNLHQTDKCMALVGNRNASFYARKRTREIARLLADKGYVIVSGLARGIDYEAHSGALESPNGRTIATLAWMDPIYPSEHEEFSKDIMKRGAIISELFNRPQDSTNRRAYSRSRFVVRNRIISGLSNFIIVAESGPSGGTIWQADLALAQKKRVYVLAPQDKQNQEKMKGFSKIVRMGAQPIRNISDLSTLEVYR